MQDLQDIYRLLAFVTVVQEGSLSAAVKKLHVTQPALSARLKLLEEGLGCTLLERTARGVKPTTMGKLVYGIAFDILKRMEQLHSTVRNHVELQEGFVHLAGGATAVAGIFPDLISEFRKKYPKIQFTLLEMTSAAIIEALHDGLIDIGLTTSDPFTSSDENRLDGLKVHLEIPDFFEIIANPEHPLAIMAKSLEEQNKCLLPMHLNRQPMITLESGSVIADLIEYELKRLGIRYRSIMTLRSTQNMIKMVKKNVGLSIVSHHALKDEKGVQVLKIQNLKISRSLLVCSVEGRKLSPAAMEFIHIIKMMYFN